MSFKLASELTKLLELRSSIENVEGIMTPIIEKALERKLAKYEMDFEYDGSFEVEGNGMSIICYGERDDPLDPFYVELREGEDYEF